MIIFRLAILRAFTAAIACSQLTNNSNTVTEYIIPNITGRSGKGNHIRLLANAYAVLKKVTC